MKFLMKYWQEHTPPAADLGLFAFIFLFAIGLIILTALALIDCIFTDYPGFFSFALLLVEGFVIVGFGFYWAMETTFAVYKHFTGQRLEPNERRVINLFEKLGNWIIKKFLSAKKDSNENS